MQRKPIKPSIKNQLLILSRGTCSYHSKTKSCNESLFQNNSNIGEIAHIISQRKNGPRHESIKGYDYDCYDNLILLCRNHHKIIDTNIKDFPKERIYKMKERHIKKMSAEPINLIDKKYIEDLSKLSTFFYFNDVNKIVHVARNEGYIHIDIFLIKDCYEWYIEDNYELKFNDYLLNSKFQTFMREIYRIADYCAPTHNFHTLNKIIEPDENYYMHFNQKWMQLQYLTAANSLYEYIKNNYISVIYQELYIPLL